MSEQLHLILSIWGRRYCDDFFAIGAATLLAAGNLGARMPDTTVLQVYTTAHDWAYMDQHPMAARLRKHLQIKPILFDLAPGEAKHITMSIGHEAMIKVAEKVGAAVIPIFADSVFAENDLTRLVALRKPLRRMIMTIGMRVAYETFTQALPFGREPVIAIEPRKFARLTVDHMHTQMRCWCADAPGYGDDIMGGPHWRTARDGLIVHSIYWEAALIDFSGGWKHDISPLRDWTIDGHYPWANTAGPETYYAVTDSDEYLHLTLAREAEYHYVPKAPAGTLIQEMRKARDHPSSDPLRQRLYEVRFRIHGSPVDLSDPSWAEAEAAADIAVRDSACAIRENFQGVNLHAGSPPWLLMSQAGINFVRYGSRVYSVPQSLGPLDLSGPGQIGRPGIGVHATLEEARAARGAG